MCHSLSLFGPNMRMSYLTSLNPQLLKNIAYVRSFKHFFVQLFLLVFRNSTKSIANSSDQQCQRTRCGWNVTISFIIINHRLVFGWVGWIWCFIWTRLTQMKAFQLHLFELNSPFLILWCTCFTFISFFSFYLWYDLFDLTSIKSIVCLKKKNCLIWYDMLWFELWIPPFWSCDAHFIPQGIFWWISVAITVSIQKLFS